MEKQGCGKFGHKGKDNQLPSLYIAQSTNLPQPVQWSFIQTRRVWLA